MSSPSNTRRMQYVGAGLLALIAIAAFVTSPGAEPTVPPPVALAQAPEPAPTAVPTPAPAPTPLPRLGQSAQALGVSLVAMQVVDNAPARPYEEVQPGHKLIAVEIAVGNESLPDAESINPLRFGLIDTQGFVYAPELGAVELPQIELVELFAGQKARGWVAFEVPAATVPAALRFEQGYSGDYVSVALTP